MDETPKRKGRPPLPPELKKPKKKPERNYHNESGYAAQKKWSAKNPQIRKECDKKRRETHYEAKFRISKDFAPVIEKIIKDTGFSANALLIDALEQKYGVILRKNVDNIE
jgi:hypothetical protein